jgi:hypothetical protein
MTSCLEFRVLLLGAGLLAIGVRAAPAYTIVGTRQTTGECHGPMAGGKPFLDTNYFRFAYGDVSQGERPIDCQDWSATEYLGTTMNGNPTVFRVNFADGRIKGYPKTMRRRATQ